MTPLYEITIPCHQHCDYRIGPGLLKHLPDALSGHCYDQIFLVYDQDLPSCLLQETFNLLNVTPSHVWGIPSSEQDKTWNTVQALLNTFQEKLLTRRCLILALGGGVIGDVVGFAASIYKRGVAWAFLPTTLIAQIDSSIGGKTAVNTTYGKNQLGTFHSPRLVIADTEILRTLPERHIQAGMAEIIKIAAMMDEHLFHRLQSVSLDFLWQNQDIFTHAARLKIAVVQDDPFEEKPLGRSRLNFGHTIGHALEMFYQPHIIHGEAIAVGMIAELTMAQSLGICHFSNARIESLTTLIHKWIPNCHHYPCPPLDLLLPYLQQDKKNTLNEISFILPHPNTSGQQVLLPLSSSFSPHSFS